jgi:hypothetical protein
LNVTHHSLQIFLSAFVSKQSTYVSQSSHTVTKVAVAQWLEHR